MVEKSEERITQRTTRQDEPLKCCVRFELPFTSFGASANYVGNSMSDKLMMRRVAGVVHSLASEFDMLSRREDLSLELMARCIQEAVSTANCEITKVSASRRPSCIDQINGVQLAINASHRR